MSSIRTRLVAISIFVGLVAALNSATSFPTVNDRAPLRGTRPGIQIKYEPSSEDFPNPERGLYYYADEYVTFPGEASAPCNEALDFNDVLNHRNKNLMTLVLRHYNLLQFIGYRIPKDGHFMKCLAADFATVRQAGVKLILRFSYNPTKGADGFQKCDQPNPQEPALSDVLSHIDDLKAAIAANSDVISVWQAGFIGTWGEWHYSNEVFGCGDQLSDSQYKNRNKVIDKMLEVLPANRPVQLRTPGFKQKYLEVGKGKEHAIKEAQAFNQTSIARLGVFDDCFVFDESHNGTFSRDSVEMRKDKEYLELESRYLPVGGETCMHAQNGSFHLWSNAQLNFKRFRWSFLNGGYAGVLDLKGNQPLQQEWGLNNLRTISKLLGYRFALSRDAEFSFDEKTHELSVDFTVLNLGWSAPYSPRGAELIIRRCGGIKCDGGQIVKRIDLIAVKGKEYDPRRWSPEAGGVRIKETFDLMSDKLTKGTYELLFSLPDPEKSLQGRADYSIQLANRMIWEGATGFNRLAYYFSVE